jgi:hypothetical protein
MLKLKKKNNTELIFSDLGINSDILISIACGDRRLRYIMDKEQISKTIEYLQEQLEDAE